MSSKHRDALENVKKTIINFYNKGHVGFRIFNKLFEICDKALDKPLRNCDVGMACEQLARFEQFCNAHKCKTCPMGYSTKQACAIHWSQTLFKSEVK